MRDLFPQQDCQVLRKHTTKRRDRFGVRERSLPSESLDKIGEKIPFGNSNVLWQGAATLPLGHPLQALQVRPNHAQFHLEHALRELRIQLHEEPLHRSLRG